jgi:hypothetical protein
VADRFGTAVAVATVTAVGDGRGGRVAVGAGVELGRTCTVGAGLGVAVGLGGVVAVGTARVGRGEGLAVGFDVGVLFGVGMGTSAICGPSEKDATADRAMKNAAVAATKTSRKAIRSGVTVTLLPVAGVRGHWRRSGQCP